MKHEQWDAHLAISIEGGPQISQDIGLRVLLPRDLSELATLEFFDESLGDRQILDHAIFLCLVLSLHLVALKLHLTALEAVFPLGEVSTIPIPAAQVLMDPLTCRTHSPSSFVSLRRRTCWSRAESKVGENSATKSGRTCDFIAVAGRKITSNSPLVPQLRLQACGEPILWGRR